MRAVFGQVCQSLTVVSNCMPGSPQTQRRLGNLPHQVARLVGVHRPRRSRTACVCPLAVVEHRAHELVGHAHRVVRVLEEHRRVGRPGERAVVAGVDQRPRLLLFLDLAVDELDDVRDGRR